MPGEVRCMSQSRSVLGENPLWDDSSGRLLSIDCMGRKLLRHDIGSGESESWELRRTPGSFVLRASGGLLMANRQGLAFGEFGDPSLQDIPVPGLDFSRELFNDGKCDSRGRFWVGTMDRHVAEPTGALYRLDPDLRITRMDQGFILSNGIAWSPDERTMYFCDSRPGRIWAYDYDAETGAITNRRLFVDFQRRQGRPDGCATDADGGLWVAEISAGQVVRFDPSGAESATIHVPVSRPTSIAFGGPGLRTLFVTSMRNGLSEDELAKQPEAGCVFAVDVDRPGLAAAPFRG